MSTNTEKTNQTYLKGGEFLIKKTNASEIFIPEDWSEEQRMIAQMCDDFISHEINPVLNQIDKMEEGLMPSILEKAGDLGLLGLSVPEYLGGLGLDFKSSLLGTERLGKGYSFSVAYGAHTGIGTLPILYYGNQMQKEKYVPKLASGEWKAAYCLTEPGSGSDANSGKTKALLNTAGTHYVLNGQKMWITNGGFADVFTVFAKIDDDKNLSAFIVDANSEGITLNPEEKKMGIKGSSTRQVFFNNVEVPIENLLHERESGFKIALNILNIGRIKLAGGVLGGGKQTITESIQYANNREQFGKSIGNYGAIRTKIAKQISKSFIVESAIYRTAAYIDDHIESLEKSGMEKGQAYLKGLEEYAAECAMLKVAGSECLDFIVDEAVQIFGGMGYSAESSVERAYRDARINRIFEGTNEINRMLTVEMILRKAMKGQLDLMTPAMGVMNELMSIPDFNTGDETTFDLIENQIQGFKKSILAISGAAVQKLGMTISEHQDLLMYVADMSIQTYLLESAFLRVKKLHDLGKETHIEMNILLVGLYESGDVIHKAGKDAALSFMEGDEQRMLLMGLRRFTKVEAVNSSKLYQEIAKIALDKNQYPFF